MPRIHASLKRPKPSASAARADLTKARLAIEQFKLARLEDQRDKDKANEDRKRRHYARYAEKQRLAEETREAEQAAKEALRLKREVWYESDQSTPYPYS